MGKNMHLIPSLLLLNKHKEIWLWPSCKHPKTLSFRATKHDFPKESLVEAEVELTTPGSYFTNSSESVSMSTESEKYIDKNDECSSMETIVRGVRSERLFFEPDPTSSILETQGSGRQLCRPRPVVVDHVGGGNDECVLPYKESVAMVMESENPYGDFKKSMEEMVESLDLKDWNCLEELLGWYLRSNGKNTHEFIVGAFVDLLAGISPISSPNLYQVGREKMIEE